MANFIPNATTTSRSMMAAVVLGTVLSSAPEIAGVESNDQVVTPVEDISKYCQACWRNARLPADRWQDATQQVFVRLLERVPTTSWRTMLADGESEERQEFVRAIDTVKKRTQRIKPFVEFGADVRDDAIANVAVDQRRAIDEIAPRVLSPRQQKIVELSFGGWAVPDIAAELGTSVQRVSDEKYKAVRKLRAEIGIES